MKKYIAVILILAVTLLFCLVGFIFWFKPFETPPEWYATIKVLDAYFEGEHYYSYALSITHRGEATLYDVKIYMPKGELLGRYPRIAPYDHVYYDDVYYQPEYVLITYYNGSATVNVVKEGP